ncbi:MAG: DMT family transporter [Gemmatimonadetes bacterium]|nr:DMT family transporter [Gemmatimonadota bacterium]MBM4191214.1 DMT family transporter [Gemmatimonadota bacterium]
MTERRATGLILLSACAFGSLSTAVVLADRAGVALIALMAWRYALAAPLLVLAAGGFGALRIPRRDAVALLLLGGTGQMVITTMSFSSLEWLTSAQLGFLFYTYPAWVALFMAIGGVERLTRGRVAALTLALAGIAMMVGRPWASAIPAPGLWLALGSAAIYAGYIPLLHRMRGPHPAAVASTYVITGAAISLSSWSAMQGTLFTNMTLPMWGLALGCAVIGTVVAFIAFLRGLEVLGAVRTAILSTLEPFWNAMLAAVVLKQGITPMTIAGGSVIMGAIVLLQRSAHPALQTDAPAPE